MKTIILIGGKGTRMQPMTDYCPKEMFPMINKPFLQIILDELKENGILDEEICFVSSYEKKNIEEYFNKYKFIYDNNKGLCKAIEQSKEFVKDDDFLLILGDMNLYGCNSIKRLIDKYKEKNTSIIGTFEAKEDFKKYCQLKLNIDLSISELIEKPINKVSPYTTTGEYIFKNSFYKYLNNVGKDGFGFTKSMQELCNNEKVFISHSDDRGFMLDVGNVENYAKSVAMIGGIK